MALRPWRFTDRFVEYSISNGEVWPAHLCRKEFIPQFLRIHEGRVDSKKLDVLKYQIERQDV